MKPETKKLRDDFLFKGHRQDITKDSQAVFYCSSHFKDDGKEKRRKTPEDMLPLHMDPVFTGQHGVFLYEQVWKNKASFHQAISILESQGMKLTSRGWTGVPQVKRPKATREGRVQKRESIRTRDSVCEDMQFKDVDRVPANFATTVATEQSRLNAENEAMKQRIRQLEANKRALEDRYTSLEKSTTSTLTYDNLMLQGMEKTCFSCLGVEPKMLKYLVETICEPEGYHDLWEDFLKSECKVNHGAFKICQEFGFRNAVCSVFLRCRLGVTEAVLSHMTGLKTRSCGVCFKITLIVLNDVLKIVFSQPPSTAELKHHTLPGFKDADLAKVRVVLDASNIGE
jgi:hypothetical protein